MIVLRKFLKITEKKENNNINNEPTVCHHQPVPPLPSHLINEHFSISYFFFSQLF